MTAAALQLPKADVIYAGTFLCALGYLFVEYGRPQSWVPAIGYLRPGVIALGAGMLALLLRNELPRDKHSRYMLAFLGWMALLVPLAVNRNRAFFQTWSMFLMLFGGVLPIALFVDTFARLQRLLRFWLFVHISLAIYAITHAGQGIGSFLIDENDLSLAMNAALPYAIALIVLEGSALLKLVAVMATLVMVFASVTSLSRGGFIGLACVGIVVWLQSRRKVLSLVGIAAVCVLVLALAPSKYWRDMSTIANAGQQGDTGYQRLYSWDIGWRMFLDHPVFGVGGNNYPHRAHEYEDSRSDEIGYHLWGRQAHSLYLTLLPELGIVGTFIFAGMVGHGLVSRHRIRRMCTAALKRSDLTGSDLQQAMWLKQTAIAMDASLVGFLVCGTFLSVLYYPHIWVLTGFTAALQQVAARFEATLPPHSSRPAGSGTAGVIGRVAALHAGSRPSIPTRT